MKKLNLFSLIAIIALFAFSPVSLNAQIALLTPGTICLKHPSAENTTEYFSSNTTYVFEVYRTNATDVERIINAMKQDPAVEMIKAGTLTGDFQAFTLVLKSAKNKDWFVKTFINAGLTSIRINRHDITSVDKM